MQDYRTYAEKNGITLKSEGPCQCCGSQTTKGIYDPTPAADERLYELSIRAYLAHH
ncbi:MAG: hypothetical protein RIF33_10390 [Cyclobacteriaceae bacterium]